MNKSTTLTRTQLTNALLTLTPQQVNDLLLFEHFKKWTCEFFALAHAVNYSTAYRRLRKLMKAGALMVRVGNPLASGGRDPDIYFPTQSGARMITRLRDRQKNYFVAPDTFNPIDNVHDLAALEATIRSGCFDGARAFQERKFTCSGKAYSIIPDAEFVSPDKHDVVFVEIEQTSRPDHIAGKYQRYVAFFNSLPPRPSPWLVVVFPDDRTKKMLIGEHEKAATAAAGDGEYNFYFATLTEMRAKRVMIYEAQLERKDGGGWTRVGEGFLDCTYALVLR